MTKATLLVGCPRTEGSVSSTLGAYMLDLLKNKGFSVSIHYLVDDIWSKESYDGMMEDVATSDILVLSYPLLMDSLPSDVIRWMELLRDERPVGWQRPSLIAIGNCDSPDPRDLDVSLAIIKNFCSSVGIRYLGGLRFPMGMSLDGKTLAEVGSKGRSAAQALELATDALADGQDVPDEAADLMASRPMSELIYLMSHNRKWKRKAMANGKKLNIYDRPLSR
ncbi:MAG: hypothetical protein HPY73_06800 [Methanomassiliicoccales archaeon]|nr:MAG: hypothetical protein HPY73_06800 [Methanomassiliicoccales archaeon]